MCARVCPCVCERPHRAVGCIFGELLLRRPLLPGATEADQLHKIYELLGPPTPVSWPDFPTLPLARTVAATPDKYGTGKVLSRFPHLSPNVRTALERGGRSRGHERRRHARPPFCARCTCSQLALISLAEPSFGRVGACGCPVFCAGSRLFGGLSDL
jgi:hypothetical protein